METQKIDLHSDSESEIDRGEVRGNIVWKGNQYPIYEGENIIGREDDCDVTIEHDSVSLKHAVLDYEDGVARMRDLKSKNGTSLESAAGSGHYIKLGPTRRNEEVKTGCKIRFGLVDCKYIEIERPAQEPEPPKKAALKYDMETQFINLAAPESDDEEEEEEQPNAVLNKSTSSNSAYDHSYDRPPVGRNPFSATGSVGSTRSVALEMETQLDQDLNSAEKALVHSANTPSSIFSSRLVQGIASGATASPAANSVMSTPIAMGLPPAPSTGHSTRNSSTSTTPSATPAVPLAAFVERNISPATATGDDECSTEDDGFEGDEEEGHNGPIDIPIPAFHPIGIAAEPLSDDSDEESDMSQDLMRVDEEQDGELQDADVEPAASLSRPATPLTLPSPSAHAPRAASAAASAVDIKPQEDIATDDEGQGEGEDNASVDFNLAQDDRSLDELHNTHKEPLSRHASLTASTYAVASSDSPFHNLASTDSRLDAPVLSDEPANVQNEFALPVPGHVGNTLPEANTEPQEFFTAQDPPSSAIVPDHLSPNTFSTSPTISGSERERAGNLRTAIRSPGAAIRDLLSSSGLPMGVKVFESQGGLVEVEHTASPALSSVVSGSLPADAPSMHFDFAAVNKGGATSSSAILTAAALARVVEKDAAELDPEVEKILQKSASKPKTARGKKRILDSDSEEEFDEPLRPPSVASHAAAAATISAAPAVEPKSAAKRSRTNPRAEVEEPVEVAVPATAVKKAKEASSSAPSTAKKAIAGRGKKNQSPLPVIVEEENQDGGEEEQVCAIAEEEAPASTKKPLAAKKGRSKAVTASATDEPEHGAVPPVEEVLAVPEKTPAKRGRGKAVQAESIEQEADLPASDDTVAQMEVVEGEAAPEVPKPTSKRGRGKATETEAVIPVPESVSEPVTTKTPAKRGKGKGSIAAEEVTAPVEEAASILPDEPAPAVVAKPAAKKGRGKAAVVEETAPAEHHPYVPEATLTASKARGKANTSKETTAAGESADAGADEAVSVPSKAAKKGLKRSATTSAEDSADATDTAREPAVSDEEIRILFTKVDDAPYLKFIKSLPRASVTNDAAIATHCVTLAELKRTPKLMVALNCGVKYVITEQWMKDCIKAKSLVEVVTETGAAPAKKAKKSDTALIQDPRADAVLLQQIRASPYVVQDAEKEKLWGFSMATTLAIPRNTPGAVKLFDQMCFFCTKGVCGETAPPADELRAIIESGGGHWLANLDEWNQYASASTSSTGTAKSAKNSAKDATDGAANTLAVISHPTVVKKEVNKKVLEAISKGDPATSGVYSIELVFLACLKQRVEFEAHQLK